MAEEFNINNFIDNMEFKTHRAASGEGVTMIESRFDSVPAEDMVAMQRFFDIGNNDMLVDSNIKTLQLVHSMSKNAKMPLYQFMLKISSKVGGRLSDRFIDKVYIYLNTMLEERRLKESLRLLKSERKIKGF